MRTNVKLVTPESMNAIIDRYIRRRETTRAITMAEPDDIGLFITKAGTLWLACDNTTADCWVEEFKDPRQAIQWLKDQEQEGEKATADNCALFSTEGARG